jgi:hypothetical protein
MLQNWAMPLSATTSHAIPTEAAKERQAKANATPSAFQIAVSKNLYFWYSKRTAFKHTPT